MARTKIRCEVIWKSIHERPAWEHAPADVPNPHRLHITPPSALSILYTKLRVDVSFSTRRKPDSQDLLGKHVRRSTHMSRPFWTPPAMLCFSQILVAGQGRGPQLFDLPRADKTFSSFYLSDPQLHSGARVATRIGTLLGSRTTEGHGTFT